VRHQNVTGQFSPHGWNQVCLIFPGWMNRHHQSFDEPSRVTGTEVEVPDCFRSSATVWWRRPGKRCKKSLDRGRQKRDSHFVI
jgi:hypothetical protein